MICRILALLIALSGLPCLAATDLAPTPPMGWNSWDSYGLTVTEAEYKANVHWLHRHLQPLGWQYVVVDEGWYLQHPGQKGAAQGFVMDANGRYVVADNRFLPSRAERVLSLLPIGSTRWASSSAFTSSAAFPASGGEEPAHRRVVVPCSGSG